MADGHTFQAPKPDFFEVARGIVAGQEARVAAELASQSGVRWSGMGHAPIPAEAVETCAARLEREHAAREAYRATPEGRFNTAALMIAKATGDERLLNCVSRGLATNADRAALLLDHMEGPAAHDARKALADFICARIIGAAA